MAIPPFGTPPTPDATSSKKGKVQLTGDLGNTAASPQVVNLHLSGDTAINHKLTSVTDPTAAQDAATKNYADTHILGLAAWDGWINLPLTPVYGSATTFTYPADLTGFLAPGDKIRVTNNGSVKYFYVLPPVTYSSPKTTITVTGGSDYSLVNSGSPVMASLSYSKMATPAGFPQWFNYTETWTGFSAAPATGICQFSVSGRTVTFNVKRNAGTSNATTATVSLPVTALSLTNAEWYSYGRSYDNGAYTTTGGTAIVGTGATTASLYKDSGGGAWTASGAKDWQGIITYEF